MFYFQRLGPNRFGASEHVGGAWNTAEQHIAPALGLLAHAIEIDHAARRESPLQIARISYDILGTLPIEPVDIEISVLRPGRTIELIEARLSHGGRLAVIARAWLLQAFDTAGIAGTAFADIPPPEDIAPWRPGEFWPGRFVRTVEVRRDALGKGRSQSWVRSDVALIERESVSATAHMLGILDIANGMAPREPMQAVAFPNVDLSVHLIASPRSSWLGLDTTVSFSDNGTGMTHSVMHDTWGPIGTVVQCLSVRPR